MLGTILHEREQKITDDLFFHMVDCKRESARLFNDLIKGKIELSALDLGSAPRLRQYPSDADVKSYRRRKL